MQTACAAVSHAKLDSVSMWWKVSKKDCVAEPRYDETVSILSKEARLNATGTVSFSTLSKDFSLHLK